MPGPTAPLGDTFPAGGRAARPDPAALVDLDRWPLTDPARRAEVVDEVRTQLADASVAVLDGFVRPAALRKMASECDHLRPLAHRSAVRSTAYLAPPEDGWPDCHPRRRTSPSSLEVVAYDLVPEDSPVRALYEWPVLSGLVRDAMGLDEIHPYGDPLGALNLATMVEGDELGWHFDQTDFVTSVALAAPGGGGEFEVARRLRSERDENYEGVAAVLDGERRSVTVVPFEPGALMLFAGRHSLHRVAPVRGTAPRHVALLAYDARPGTDSTDALKLSRYGRLSRRKATHRTWPDRPTTHEEGDR